MIVITAPTGQIGSVALARLLQGEEPVRVVVRDPARLPDEVRDRVEVVEGSHGDADVLDRALDGADALFWLVPAAPDAPSIWHAYVGFSLTAADAIVRYGVTHVVTVSGVGRDVQGFAGNVSATIAMDDLIRRTGTHTRELANPSFLDNLLRQTRGIAEEGVIRGILPSDLRLPMVATRDIGTAAAALLADRSWTGQEAVPLLGPEDLSPDEQAAILTEVLGRPVRYERGDRDATRAALLTRGVSPGVADALIAMDVAKEQGLDRSVARSPANTTSTSLRAWAEEVLRPAVETVGR